MTTDTKIPSVRPASTRFAGGQKPTSRREAVRRDVARELPGYPASAMASVGFVAGLQSDGRPAV